MSLRCWLFSHNWRCVGGTSMEGNKSLQFSCRTCGEREHIYGLSPSDVNREMMLHYPDQLLNQLQE